MPRKAIVAVFVVGLVLAVGSSLATAKVAFGGGGGCPEPQSDAHGTTVDVKEFCMLPTAIRVDQGATITWKNWDEAAHTVTGAAVRSGRPGAGSWGSFEPLVQNQTYSHTFNDSGVFPYYCMLHPGMVGAVVVGDGVDQHPYAPGGGGVAGTDPRSASQQSQAQTQAQQRPSTSSSSAIDAKFIIVVAAFAVATAVGAAYSYRRYRSTRRDAVAV